MANEKRLIDANALKHFVCKLCNAVYSDAPCEPSDCRSMEVINEMPTVEAVEVVHGRWIRRGNEMKCSQCKFIYYSNHDDFNYCPNCGAKMDGDGNG